MSIIFKGGHYKNYPRNEKDNIMFPFSILTNNAFACIININNWSRTPLVIDAREVKT